MNHNYAGCQVAACLMCDAYGDGYAACKEKMAFEIEAVLDAQNHASGCGCRPCTLVMLEAQPHAERNP